MSKYYSLKHLSTKSSMAICRALKKHGLSNFILEILEYCEPVECIGLEQHWLDFFKSVPSYNILQIAGSRLGSITNEETRAKISAYQMGRKKSLEDKANISASMMGNNNGKNSSLKIEVTDLELGTKTLYNSMGEAARALNIAACRISNYFAQNQQKPYIKRYVFTKHS
jgi:group I intron endonuclease